MHDHWEDHSLDYMDLCWQSTVSAFQHTAKKQSSPDLVATALSAVVLEPKKRESVTPSPFAPSICHAVMFCHALNDILLDSFCDSL